MADISNIDLNGVEASKPGGRGAIPIGEYKAMIIKEEAKKANSGKGFWVRFTFQIIDGEHKGFELTHLLNLHHENPIAQEIARKDLEAIRQATRTQQGFSDTQELHNKPLMLHVGHERGTYVGNQFQRYNKTFKELPEHDVKIFNNVKGFSPIGADAHSETVKPQTQASQPQTETVRSEGIASSDASAPWGEPY